MIHKSEVEPVFGTKRCKENPKDDANKEETGEAKYSQQNYLVPASPDTRLPFLTSFTFNQTLALPVGKA